jgi:ferredoxin-NADP reductase
MLETLSSGSKTRKILFKHRNNTALVGEFDHLYLIGGGTGITPLYQIIQFISDVEVPLGKGPKLLFCLPTKQKAIFF